MARLDQLPLELLILTAQSLHNQKDISALVRTNKTLHHALYALLCRFNVEHHQSSALLWAARNGYTDLATRLLDAGANISSHEGLDEDDYNPYDLVDLSEVNPLLAAAQGGHLGTLKAMLSEKRPGRASSPAQLRTVFHWAIRSRASDLVELMIENNAPLDPAGTHPKALSALSVAIDSGNNSIIPRLLELGARSGLFESPCPVELAICTDQPQLVELLLKHGMQPHDNDGLGHIIRRNDKALLQLLLDYGLKLKFYLEPLFIAIMEGQYEMVEMLIDNGVNPNLTHSLNTRDEEGYDKIYALSPVGFAIQFRRLDILKLLLDKDILPGRSDLELAAERKYEEAMVLLSKFADQELPERKGASDLWMTEQWNVPDFRMPAISYQIEDTITPEAGDECALIAAKNGITLSDFYSWNPAVGSTCSSLQAGYWVCIGVSGGTATTHATTTKTTTSTTTTAGTGPTPTQSGIIADCSAYYQAQDGDDCWSIINKKYSYLTAAKFYEWNPAIGPSCSNLQQGYYYCVATKREGPMPDTISSCAKWHLVASGDSCWSIEQEYSITSTQFASWNPCHI
ncbi:hypothetical protein APSETT445_000701 [Aspergillus pseudonomiae]